MRWDAAATVEDRRFNSRIMDSNDPYLHLSKYFYFAPVSLLHFLRFGLFIYLFFFFANRVCFMAILRGTVRRAAPPYTFYQPVSGVRLLNLWLNWSFCRCLFKFAANRKRQVIVVVQVRQGQRLAL